MRFYQLPKSIASVGTELEEQKKLFEWKLAKLTEGHESLRLLMFVPNGSDFLNRFAVLFGDRYGIVSGFPDLFFPKPIGPYHGLFIELKRTGWAGRTTRKQRLVGNLLEQSGYRFRVCRGCGAAIREILDYEGLG